MGPDAGPGTLPGSAPPADRVIAPPLWDVAVRLTLGPAASRFALDVAFTTGAERLVLFGPSGAGKSLTLKLVAGLLAADAGHVRLAGKSLFDRARGVDVPTAERKLGYLFQEYALFPHLTVRQNVAFGTRSGWRNPPRLGRVDDDVASWLATFELDRLGERYPDELSGGQRQRTALARALAAKPKALLLDEPFAALDAPLRARLRAELATLQQRLALPVILITHDPADVEAFASEVVVLAAGRVVATAAE